MLALARRVAFVDSPPSHLGTGPGVPAAVLAAQGSGRRREAGIATPLWGLGSAKPPPGPAFTPSPSSPPLPLTIIYVCKDLKCFSPSCSVKIRDAMHWKRDQGLL